MNKLNFKNAALGFLISAAIGTILSYFVPDFIESATLIFGILFATIVISIWITIFVLEKMTGVRMGIWSAVGYVVGVAILTAIIFIPIAVVAVLLDNYEISKIITPALNVLFIAIYSLLAGYLFCKEYKKDDDKSATKDQGESQE